MKSASEQAKTEDGICLIHFDTHLDTNEGYFGAQFTHGTPFKRAVEQKFINGSTSFHVGCHGSLYTEDCLTSKFILRWGLPHCNWFLRWGTPSDELKSGILKVKNTKIPVGIDFIGPSCSGFFSGQNFFF